MQRIIHRAARMMHAEAWESLEIQIIQFPCGWTRRHIAIRIFDANIRLSLYREILNHVLSDRQTVCVAHFRPARGSYQRHVGTLVSADIQSQMRSRSQGPPRGCRQLVVRYTHSFVPRKPYSRAAVNVETDERQLIDGRYRCVLARNSAHMSNAYATARTSLRWVHCCSAEGRSVHCDWRATGVRKSVGGSGFSKVQKMEV